MNKDFLKELIFAAIKKAVHDCGHNDDDYFLFKYSDDRTRINFDATVEIICGNSCYDSEEGAQSHETRHKQSLYFFDIFHINEVVESFLLRVGEIPREKLGEYFDNRQEFYINSRIEEKEVDDYYNHLKVRSSNIPIEEITQYLLGNAFVLPVQLMKERLDIIWTKDLEAGLQAHTLEETLDKKNKPIRKSKKL